MYLYLHGMLINRYHVSFITSLQLNTYIMRTSTKTEAVYLAHAKPLPLS